MPVAGSQWEALVDETGETYYSNVEGTETAWDLPEGVVLVDRSGAGEAAAAAAATTTAAASVATPSGSSEPAPDTKRGSKDDKGDTPPIWSPPSSFFMHGAKSDDAPGSVATPAASAAPATVVTSYGGLDHFKNTTHLMPKEKNLSSRNRGRSASNSISARETNSSLSGSKNSKTASALMRAARMAKTKRRKSKGSGNGKSLSSVASVVELAQLSDRRRMGGLTKKRLSASMKDKARAPSPAPAPALDPAPASLSSSSSSSSSSSLSVSSFNTDRNSGKIDTRPASASISFSTTSGKNRMGRNRLTGDLGGSRRGRAVTETGNGGHSRGTGSNGLRNFGGGRKTVLPMPSTVTAAHRSSLDERQETMQELHVFPVKEALKALYRVNRWKTLFGAGQWVIFLFLMFLVLSLVENKNKVFEQESALADLFLDEEFVGSSYKKNFAEIYTVDELWEWIEGPLVQGAYPVNAYNGVRKPEKEQGYILNVMRLVGGVRIRQHRVTKDSCTSRRFLKKPEIDFPHLGCVGYKKDDEGSRGCFCNATQDIHIPGEDTSAQFTHYPICPLDRADESCYSEYITGSGYFNFDQIQVWLKTNVPFLGGLDDQTHADLGTSFRPRDFNRSGDVTAAQEAATTRYKSVQLGSILKPCRPHFGKGAGNGITHSDFGSVGYYQDLPATNVTLAKEILRAMKGEQWIDVQTRAVGITFNVYNTMTRYLTVSRFTVEIGVSGRIFTRGEFFTFPLRMYGDSGNSNVRLFFEILVLGFYAYFVQKEFFKAFKMGCSQYFCKRKSTFVEWAVLLYIGMFLSYYYWLVGQIQFSKKFMQFHVLETQYQDFAGTGGHWQSVITFGGILFLVSTIKLIKFLALSKQAMLLFRTVSEASGILSSFLITMGTLLIFFALATHYVYGNRIPEFQGYIVSVLQMIRWILGDLNYEILDEVRPDMTPWLYVGHQIIFFFLATNMLIAIVISQFDAVRVKAQLESKWKREVPGIWDDTRMRMSVASFRMCRRCHRDHRSLRLVEMSMKDAKMYVRKQKTRNKYHELVKSPEWHNAYKKVLTYWRAKRELEFQRAIRRLQRFGKSFDLGGGVRLYDYLERLYNSWEERAVDALEGGLFDTNDTRLPVACISAERLAFYVCKTESFEMHLATRKSRLERKSSRSASIQRKRTATRVSQIDESQENSSDSDEERFTSERKVIRSSMYQGSEDDRSLHKIRAFSLKGTKVAKDCDQCHTRCLLCCLCCRCSSGPARTNNSGENGKSRGGRKTFIGLYRSRVEQDEHNEDLGRQGLWCAQNVVDAFNKARASLIVAPIVANSSQWTNDESIVGEKLRLVMPAKEMRHSLFDVEVSTGTVNSAKRKRNVFIDKVSAQLYILEPCDIRPSTTMELEVRTKSDDLKPGRSSWSDGGLHIHEAGFEKVTSKATGPIRIIVDLLDLQQIHSDCVCDQTCSLCLDDRVGRNFTFKLMNKSLRDAFVTRLVETCAQFEGGSDEPSGIMEAMRESRPSSSALDAYAAPPSGFGAGAGTAAGSMPTARVPRGSFSGKMPKRGARQSLSKIPCKPEMRQTQQTAKRTLTRTLSKQSVLAGTVQDRGKRKAKHRRSTIMRQSGDLSALNF